MKHVRTIPKEEPRRILCLSVLLGFGLTLGHSSISTTMRYVHPTREHKREAVRKLERFNLEQVFTVHEGRFESPQKSPQ